MIRIDKAKTNNDGSITIKATYNDTTLSQLSTHGIYKYFITRSLITRNPDEIDHADVSLVVYYVQLDNAVSELDVTINDVDIMADTLNEVLFVYVVTNEDELMLCQCKDKYDMKSTFPLCNVYKNFMGFVNSLNHDECNIPMDFIDLIMRYIYLMSAYESGNYYRVKEIWDTYFKNVAHVNMLNPNCGCHG